MHARLLLPALLASSVAAKPKRDDAILLSKVKTLTLHEGKQTTHKRVSAIPQLRCVSQPRVCALHTIDVMRCTNQGSSYGDQDIEWSCTASLPPELKLGATEVMCEGYTGSEDPYVVRGSCGVEYRLVLTELGEQRFPDIANAGSGGWFSGWGSGGKGKGEPLRSEEDDAGSSAGAWLFSIIFIGVLLWIVYSAWAQSNNIPRNAPRRLTDNWFDGGGGGGGGGFDPGFGPGGGGGGGSFGGSSNDTPPPYSKYPSSSSRNRNQNQEGWRPGFWSGVAGGAAAGYLAGNRGNRQQEQRNSYGGGGWGSQPGPSSSSSRRDSGTGSTSSSRYTSTGFGSTSRR